MVDKGKGKNKSHDETWDHCEKVEEGKNRRLKLKYKHCGNAYWGGISRMKHHLARTRKDVAACTKNHDEVFELFKALLESKKKKDDDDFIDLDEGSTQLVSGGNKKFMMDAFLGSGQRKQAQSSQTTLNTIWKKGDREKTCLDICRCLYANALPFNLVKSPYFKSMMESVASFGPGLKLPSYHEVRTTFLKKEVETINLELIEKYKVEWKRTGCTLMSDGWTDGKSRSITNFLVNSPRGTVFLKSIDTSDISKNADNLFELLDSMVEEIGEENVVQVVTDSAAAYVKAGELLMEKRKKLFWSPCAAHCLDLVLSDIGDLPTHLDTVTKARKITVYIYRHSWVLNLMRKHTKGRDLARAGVTRFATSYLTLRSIQKVKIGLRAMFGSQEWQRSQYAKKADGIKIQEIILADHKFWLAIKYCLKCVLPLVKVLRLVDGDAKPAMGYIYEAMDKAKEQIAKNFNQVKKRYNPIWEIIDRRWDMQLHRPLHAAGYFFNPRFHYSDSFYADYEIKMGVYETIQRMCPSPILREKIDKQLDVFHNAEKMFSMDIVIQMRDKKQSALWWESFGGGCKDLQTLAIRILNLTCSATGCERNWSTFDQVHSKRRNRLEQQRLNALVFVKYNLQLEARHKKRLEQNDSYDPICLSDMESEDEWITEKENPCLPEDNSWMDVHECFEIQGEGENSQKRKRGPRDLSSQRKAKGKKKVDDYEEEDVIEDEEFDEEEVEEADDEEPSDDNELSSDDDDQIGDGDGDGD